MKRIKSLVTGGCGFIGSHIVDRLVELDHIVIVIDDQSSLVSDEFYKNNKADYYQYSILDKDNIASLFQDADYVFHLAAETRIQNSINYPSKCVETNSLGTAILLDLACKFKIKKFIYSSTSSIYGSKNGVPFTENMPEDCLNPYSISKFSGEKFCQIYYSLYGLPTISLRYFNVYGPRSPMKGRYATVVGKFLHQYSTGMPLTIYGDGTQRRDFTFIDDVVDANILAMYDNNSNNLGQAFNIGRGKNYSILELAQHIGGQHIFTDPPKGESKETLADISKAYTAFGWSPKVDLIDYIKKIKV